MIENTQWNKVNCHGQPWKGEDSPCLSSREIPRFLSNSFISTNISVFLCHENIDLHQFRTRKSYPSQISNPTILESRIPFTFFFNFRSTDTWRDLYPILTRDERNDHFNNVSERWGDVSYSLVAWDDSQKRTKINPPTRSVARKKDPELQPITASLPISISTSVILTEPPRSTGPFPV